MVELTWLYECSTCRKRFPLKPGLYLCPECARRLGRNDPLAMAVRPLDGVLECVWEGDYDGGADDIPLPVPGEFFPSLPVGNTPLWEPQRLRAETGFPFLFLKDDCCEPSGSFKDRASVLVAAFARQHGIKEIALASTGNAASSMACVGAAAGLDITVFLPKAAPQAKRVQVLQYGAKLVEVDGTYDDALGESLAYTSANGVLSRNTAFNPLTIEGKKTVSFEMCRDLAWALHAAGVDEPAPAFVAPDHVFVPVGDGVIIAGVYKGFEDLVRLGRIRQVPMIWACQAEGSSAIARALEQGGFGPAVPSSTLADSIAVDVPSNGHHALRKLQKYNGRAVIVNDTEILRAQRELAAKSGLFAEPSSSAAWAAFRKVKELLDHEARVVVMLTGSGLKDIAGAMKALAL
ncbi:MAG: hypothetical protein A2087_04670 [Spirochaetes bacterium GWD1_61_31]|nr:MAG: hypothetical protein A2Y37_09205 [Spirochaetes bacterium GWB1_60_80]OHD40556.1 MAG: hypothetical protein A2087_04670 [Spirochaetes bacterium GWD1_61_31]OHD44057.1 MAG: hypothetical protein A2Y35_01845 [Spirochaetes bacterium GWE1_60_18]OHD59092.1 MAG: hypothetical protein A2Y32_02565 [Spirochaetes bacterium GWF1_60_12]HAP44545.1 pyridoxal-5'-phosphate-dependent protein subunit beta [Spirochaetaceae bacterium]